MKYRNVIAAVLMLACAAYLQTGGIGLTSLVYADDITLRQATCEIISSVFAVAALLLWAERGDREED